MLADPASSALLGWKVFWQGLPIWSGEQPSPFGVSFVLFASVHATQNIQAMLRIVQTSSPEDFDSARALFRAYAESLGVIFPFKISPKSSASSPALISLRAADCFWLLKVPSRSAVARSATSAERSAK